MGWEKDDPATYVPEGTLRWRDPRDSSTIELKARAIRDARAQMDLAHRLEVTRRRAIQHLRDIKETANYADLWNSAFKAGLSLPYDNREEQVRLKDILQRIDLFLMKQ